MTKLTPKQLTDILFQKPERITADILQRNSTGIERFINSISSVFTSSTCPEPPRRTLNQAEKELSAFGLHKKSIDTHLAVVIVTVSDILKEELAAADTSSTKKPDTKYDVLWAPRYHLGYRVTDKRFTAEQLKKVSEVVEETAYTAVTAYYQLANESKMDEYFTSYPKEHGPIATPS